MTDPIISDLYPIIDIRTGHVEAWRCRLTLQQEQESIFDIVEQPIEEPGPGQPGQNLIILASRKPVSAWTQAEVQQFVRSGPTMRRRLAMMRHLLERRCYRRPVESFTLEQLANS